MGAGRLVLAVLLVGYSSPEVRPLRDPGTGQVKAAPVRELYVTRPDPQADPAPPAAWYGPRGMSWLLAADRKSDTIVVRDATCGRELQRFGARGSGPTPSMRPGATAGRLSVGRHCGRRGTGAGV